MNTNSARASLAALVLALCVSKAAYCEVEYQLGGGLAFPSGYGAVSREYVSSDTYRETGALTPRSIALQLDANLLTDYPYRHWREGLVGLGISFKSLSLIEYPRLHAFPLIPVYFLTYSQLDWFSMEARLGYALRHGFYGGVSGGINGVHLGIDYAANPGQKAYAEWHIYYRHRFSNTHDPYATPGMVIFLCTALAGVATLIAVTFQ